MRRVFLSIGSNLQPEKHVPACIQLLQEKFPKLKISSIYETDPVGPAGSKKFWNLAAEIETALSKEDLRIELRQIEEQLGRRRNPSDKFAPREIDIDILPQPDYQSQAFIVIPLSEIAPHAKDEETGKTFGELARSFGKEKEAYKKTAYFA